jgi:hypothetical protein
MFLMNKKSRNLMIGVFSVILIFCVFFLIPYGKALSKKRNEEIDMNRKRSDHSIILDK